MAVDVGAEHEMVNGLQYFFENTCAGGGQIEDYRECQEREREIDAKEGQRYSNNGTDDRHHGADGRAADFPAGDFRIFDVFGIEHISAHPVEGQAD